MTSNQSIQRIRNIGIIAHIDAGKTTTTERILFYSGYIHRLGGVDEGTTVTDWWDQERERGITITAAAITTNWRDTVTGEEAQINIIDTPGHIDFTAEVQRSLRVLDGGVVIFDAVNGVEPQSETVWHQADAFGVPRICYINKMDRIGASVDRTVQMMREQLGTDPLLLQLPIGIEDSFSGVVDLIEMTALTFTDELGAHPTVQDVPPDLMAEAQAARATLVERIAEADDELLEKFFEGETLSNTSLYQALRRAVIANKLVPVLVGTSLRNKGVQPLLNAIVRYLPNPLEVRPVKGVDPKTGDPVTRPADPKAPFSALAFKIVTDPYVGRLAYVRVYSGSLKAGSRVYNVNRGRSERASRLLQMQADQRNEIDVCVAGDIVAIVGLKQTFTGETLSDAGNTLLLETIDFPDPVINIAIEAPSRADQDRLHDILNKLAEEDPTFRIHFDTESGQTLISGMGELHLEIIVERIRRDFNLPCKVGSPQVALRETITKPAKAEGRYIQQTGGHGHYAVVWLEVEPNERGAGFVFENRITGGVIPRQFIPAVERGVTMSIENGVLAGYPIVDVKVALVDGKFHDVDSSSTDFEVAASFAFKAACEKAGPILLEPIMQVEASAPKEYLGNLVHDFGRRRGDVARLDTGGEQIHKVHALVPLREMIGYATDLRSMTTGRGIFTMQLDHHAPTPEDVTRRILGDYFP